MHLLFEFGQHLGYVRLVGSDIYSEFGQHLGYVRLVGSGIYSEFGQHLGCVHLVGSDIYSLSSASTWAMFAWLVQTFTL